MKKIFFYVLITISSFCLSLTTKAQQIANSPNPPEKTGQVLQAPADIKAPVVSPVTDEKKLHQTATPKSSVTGQVPVKMDAATLPYKQPEQKPLAETNKLVVPNPKKYD